MKRKIAFLLSAVLLIGELSMLPSIDTQAAGGRLKRSAARALAIVHSLSLETDEMSVDAKEAAYEQAVKSTTMKQKDLKAFRWSPLFGFKFPQQANFSQATEFTLKPVEAQLEITEAQHKYKDQIYAEYEKVDNLFVDINVLEDKIAYEEQCLAEAESNLQRNQTRLRHGLATQNDVKTMEAKVKTLTKKIGTDEKAYNKAKTNLGKAVNLDLITGWTFENAYVTANISRQSLQGLIDYTLERDHNYFLAKTDEWVARQTLQVDYRVMKSFYGGKMSSIDGYIQMALNGQSVPRRPFKRAYDAFIKSLPDPWKGKFKILFIKLPKAWLQGNLDGERYIQDEPYALYTATTDYVAAVAAKKEMEEAVISAVTEAFDGYISLRNSYNDLVEQAREKKKEVDQLYAKNKVGKCDFATYDDALKEYQELQIAAIEALGDYSKALYSLDRTTCGGITSLLSGSSMDINTGAGGKSYIEPEEAGSAYYFIRPIVEDNAFELYIHVPADAGVTVTAFELWVDNKLIGERTSADGFLKHLILADTAKEETKIRLYNGEKFVADCVIDPEIYFGNLSIIKEYKVITPDTNEVGNYQMTINENTGLTEITFEITNDEVKAIILKDDGGKPLINENPRSVERTFTYLPDARYDLDRIIIEYYGQTTEDADGNPQVSDMLYEGYFDTTNMRLMKK